MSKMGEAPAEKFVEKIAAELEKIEQIKPPEWASLVKTGVSKERPPTQENWWYLRSASVLRKIAAGKPLGVSRLRREYGSKKNRGHQPERKYPASGSIIRKILQQLEAAELVKTRKTKGRITTQKGKIFLNDIAKSVRND
ncbi:MAG: 30S ribosomal protein S19e [Candidatus Aenigmarchaeota archaeon]|nr:30S ribosomal protein S19e [Candidatus Aenigmarchaeota archaeon]